jgi:Zn finger protein HypA/HybF involved in hydrogenase expression
MYVYVPPRCKYCGKPIKVSKFGQNYCPHCGSLQLQSKFDKEALKESNKIAFIILTVMIIVFIIIVIYLK